MVLSRVTLSIEPSLAGSAERMADMVAKAAETSTMAESDEDYAWTAAGI